MTSLSNLKKFLLCSVLLAFVSGCASLRSVSMTSFPKDRSRPVQAKVKKFVFLALNFNNDFVLDLVPQLKKQCPDGKVTGITSKYETRFYFFAYKMIVTSEGFCVHGKGKGKKRRKSRRG